MVKKYDEELIQKMDLEDYYELVKNIDNADELYSVVASRGWFEDEYDIYDYDDYFNEKGRYDNHEDEIDAYTLFQNKSNYLEYLEYKIILMEDEENS